MVVVSVINYKGGVGKTTLTANIGAELAWRGYSTLLIDLDPQASLTFSFVQPDYWTRHLEASGTIKSWFDAAQRGGSLSLASLAMEPSRVRGYLRNRTSARPLRLIPSHLGLINVDLELATELGGASVRQAKLNYMRVHRRLAEGLTDPGFSDYDVILIDCPPNFNVVTKTAIVASDHVLIPAKPDYLSTLGIDYLQRNLRQLVDDYNEYVGLDDEDDVCEIDPAILGVVFTMIQVYGGQPIRSQRQYIQQVTQLGVPVFDHRIRENKTHYATAPEEGAPVVLRGGSTHSTFVQEFEGLVDEFCAELGI